MTHLHSGVLQIYPVHADDSGLYRCRGINAAGMTLGSDTQVVVTPGKLFLYYNSTFRFCKFCFSDSLN